MDAFIWRPEDLEALSRREGFARLEDDAWYPVDLIPLAYHRGYDLEHHHDRPVVTPRVRGREGGAERGYRTPSIALFA